ETMVAAVDMATHGLGGDSEVTLRIDGLSAQIILGPQKAMPLSLLAMEHQSTLATLSAQLRRETPHDQDARFAVATGRQPRMPLAATEAAVFSALTDGPQPLETLCPSRQKLAAAERLRKRGLLTLAAFTPSDAAHVLGHHSGWSIEAARLGAALHGRRRDGRGEVLAQEPEAFCTRVLDALTRRSTTCLLQTTFAAEGLSAVNPDQDPLVAALLYGEHRMLSASLKLATPLIALGASAATHYPAIANVLSAQLEVPEHADVANAVGAVAGQVRLTRTLRLTEDPAGGFTVFLPDGPKPYGDRKKAMAEAEAALEAQMAEASAKAGAADAPITLSWILNEAEVEGRRVLIEGVLTGTATGRPATIG
ncbi:MAG: hydantoinase/oxoprolinase family protein, partial [Pseudomonadota bacterium]